MARTRTTKKTKSARPALKVADQPMTAATIWTEVAMTGAQRLNILHEITGKEMTFDTSRKYGRIWDAVLGEWDWSELYKDTRLLSDDERKAYTHMLDGVANTESPLRMTRQLLEELQVFLREKLDESAPAQGKDGKAPPDNRWKGQRAIVMRKLYDKIERLIGEEQ